jgi:hypothetical protein
MLTNIPKVFLKTTAVVCVENVACEDTSNGGVQMKMSLVRTQATAGKNENVACEDTSNGGQK